MPEEQTIRGTPEERERKYKCAPPLGHKQYNSGRTWFKKNQVWTEKQLETRKNNFKKLFKRGFKGTWCGKKLSLEHRQSISKGMLKKKDWNGFVYKDDHRIRRSKEYIIWRTAVFVRDDYTCQNCGSRGGGLQADHIKPFSKYPELRFAIDNGRTLCVECHKVTNTYGWSLYHA